jgi:hypothetical protein
LSAQPTGILGTKLKLSRQRALGLGFGLLPGDFILTPAKELFYF